MEYYFCSDYDFHGKGNSLLTVQHKASSGTLRQHITEHQLSAGNEFLVEKLAYKRY